MEMTEGVVLKCHDLVYTPHLFSIVFDGGMGMGHTVSALAPDDRVFVKFVFA